MTNDTHTTEQAFECAKCDATETIAIGQGGLTVDQLPVCGDCNTPMLRAKETAVSSQNQDRAIEEAINSYREENPHSRMVR